MITSDLRRLIGLKSHWSGNYEATIGQRRYLVSFDREIDPPKGAWMVRDAKDAFCYSDPLPRLLDAICYLYQSLLDEQRAQGIYWPSWELRRTWQKSASEVKILWGRIHRSKNGPSDHLQSFYYDRCSVISRGLLNPGPEDPIKFVERVFGFTKD